MADDAAIDLTADFRGKTRVLKRSGKTKTSYRVEFKADPLIVSVDGRAAAADFAASLRDQIQAQMRGVPETVKQSTWQRRQRAIKDAGRTHWYKRRYQGGRSSPSAPTGGWRKVTDSGRMADNLALRVRQEADSNQGIVTLNVPANRLNEDLWGDHGSFVAWLQELRRLVPLLGGHGDVKTAQALDAMLARMIANSEARYRRLKRERAKAILAAGRALVGM